MIKITLINLIAKFLEIHSISILKNIMYSSSLAGLFSYTYYKNKKSNYIHSNMEISNRFSFNLSLLKSLLLTLGLSVFALNNLSAQDCPTITSEGIFDPNSDVLITSYHSSMAKTTTNIVAWGEDMAASGGNANTITEVIPGNGYTYTGTPIHFGLSGNGGAQGFLATTTSLYVWGNLGEVISADFGTDNAFNDMNATQTLPFTAANITQIHASSDVLFVISAGEIWVATSGTTAPTGNDDNDDSIWQQVETSSGVPLTGVANVTGNKYAGYALLGNGDIYTWGDDVVLGNGTGAQDLDFATQMMAPPVPITYIASFMDNPDDSPTGGNGETGLLALGSDTKIYGVGHNTDGELITSASNLVNTWTAVQASGGGDFVGAIQLSTSHTSEEHAGASVITAGATASDTNILYTWGISSSSSLGHGGFTDDPTIPPSFTVGTDDPVHASVGGHATTFFNRANGGSICFVGHVIDGSEGGLTSTGNDQVATSFECVIPATVELCGFADPCANAIASGTLIWETAPTNSSEFDWTPDGSLANTFNDISGSGINATVAFTGDTGSLGIWGTQTPNVGTDNGDEALQFFTNGFNATGITITITFSETVNVIDFDLSHINGSGPNGDSYTITANDVVDGAIFPTFTESANPSYTTNSSGFIDSNDNSTSGTNDEAGVNFTSANGISSITLVWDECTACTAGTVHGSAIKDISFCKTTLSITANDDNGSVIEGVGGVTIVNVLSNDDLDGNVPAIGVGGVTLTQLSTSNGGVTLNTSTGAVNVTAGTPVGNYVIEYQICETDTPTNCTTAFAYVEVLSDVDGDGVDDITDLDDDNDGILDINECSPSKTVDILIQSSDLTYIPSGNAGNIGDSATYANVGSYEGTAIDLRITVLNNSDTANLVADLSGESFDPGGGQPIIYYPIYLSSTGPATTGFANFDFEFLINGSNTLIEVPANMVFQDIDDTTPGELIEFNKEDILNYEVTTATSLLVANNVSLSSFGTSGDFLKVTSTGNAPAANDENLWFSIQMPFIDEFDITFSKRQFDTGYLFNTIVFGNPTTTTQVTPGCTSDFDNDGIPDYLDLDSDNDGCPDAIEGAATNIGLTQLNPDGSINTSANGGVSSTGVPNLANSGAGQAIGSSIDDSVLALECSVAITIENVTVDEGDGTATVPVTIDAISTLDTVIDIVTTAGTAGTSDYTTTTTTVTIPAGQTSVDVVIPILEDTEDELDETFTVNGTVTSGNASNTNPVGTVTIQDNDSVIVTIGDVTVDEGDGTATVPVTLNAPSAVATVVDIVTTAGTAGTSDYTTTTTTVTIPAGATSVDVIIPILEDTIDELDETFTVDGTVDSGDVNVAGSDLSGTVTIQDNDSVIVTIGDVTVDEGDGTATVPVTLNAPSAVAAVVDIVTTAGTAGTSDYTTTTTTVTIPAGATSVDVIIPILEDTIDELDETFTVDGTVDSGDVNVAGSDLSGTVTIQDNDSVIVTIGDVTVDEGDGTATVPVTLNAPSAVATVVDIVTTAGTAGTSDYTTTTTTVTIPAGATSVDVIIPILEDTIDELDETFTVDGTVDSGDVNVAGSDLSGTVTIQDNDSVIVTIGDVTVDEGDGTATVPVTLNAPSAVATVVDIVTTAGTAGTSDYTTTTTTVTIPAGATSVDVIIPILEDTIDELDETFTVDGTVDSGDVNVAGSDLSGTVTIQDNDSVIVTIGDVTVDEGDGTATVPVTLNAPSAVATVVDIVTTAGTAGTSDYTTTTTTVTIPAGATSVDVIIPILEDTIDELDETFTVDGTVDSGDVNVAGSDLSGTVTIQDNDSVIVTIGDVTVDEGDGTATVPVTLNAPSAVATVLDIVTTAGTAGTSDYTTTTTTVTIPAGATSVDVIIPILEDTIDELDETFTVDGTVDSGDVNVAGSDLSGTVTIQDNDSVIVTIGDVTVDEGDGTATVPVTLNAPSAVATVVDIVTTAGTAGTSDYTTTTTTVTIPAGATSVDVIIPILDDTIDELDETFTVDGTVDSGDVNVAGSDLSGTVTIQDNDSVIVTIGDVTVDEGDGTATVPVTLNAPSAVATVVDIVTTAGTAGTSDYTTTTTTVTIPAGATSVDVIIPILDDTIDELDETFTVDGTVDSGDVNVAGSDLSGTVTIQDNDSVIVTIGDVTVDEGDGTATVPVTLNVPSAVATVVDIVTTAGTAGTSDYTTTTTTVTIPAGATSVDVIIPILEDTIDELDETFTVDGTVDSGDVNVAGSDLSGTVTIQDNDSVIVTIGDVTVDEGDGTATVPVTLNAPSAVATVVDIVTTAGTAGTSDYTTTTTTVTIPAGATSVDVIIPILDDTIDELDETFTVDGTVDSGDVNVAGSDLSGTVTIQDNDSVIVTIGDVTVDEGDGTATVPVTLNAPSAVATVVDIVTTAGTAGTSDYTTTTTTVTIPAGATSVDVIIPILEDTIDELDETFTVDGTVDSGDVNVAGSDLSGTVTIQDNDSVIVTIGDVTVDEGDGTATVPVTLNAPSAVATVVDIVTTAGTAGTSDYTTTTTTVTIPAGATSVDVIIPILEDTIDELDETFTVDGTVDSGDVNVAGSDLSGTVTIQDNDSVIVTIGDVTVDEGDGTATVPVTLNAPSAVAAVVDIVTTAGTAGTSDYTTTTTTVTIPAGATSVDVIIPILEDTIDELDETFTVDGTVDSGDVNVAGSDLSGTVTIQDNDSVIVTIGDVTVDEGDGTATVPVTLNAPSAVATVVDIVTTAGTAGTSDYTTTTTTVTIPAGATSVDVIIPILDDTIDELDETFTVDGTVDSGDVNVAGSDLSGTVTIQDNDSVIVTIGDVTVDEGDGTATVPVTLNAPSAVATVLDIVTTAGTAGTSDYTTTTTTVTIPAGATSVDVIIPILDDTIDELDETFTVDGTVDSGDVNVAGSDLSGTVTIQDNDSVIVTIGDVTVDEGDGTATVPVTLNAPSAVATVVDIVTTAGTAGTSDYTTTTTTVTIPAGQTSVDVIIPILDDTTDEPSEDFTVGGTVTSGNTFNTDPSGTVTITDNDPTPTVIIGDVTVEEGDGTVTVPVTIDVPSSVDTIVDIVTTTGTAGTSDYTETTTTVVIPAGATSVDVIIPITDDTISESPEDFTVDGTVTSGNTTNTDPSGTVTITDDDSVNVTIGDVTVDEGDGTATVPVTLSIPSSVDTIITIVTTDGTAGTSDYTTTTTTVVIPAGATSVNVSVPILDDTTDEPSEDFTVGGTVTSGNTFNTDPSGTVTITDNDPTPTVIVGDVTVDEGDGTATVPVTLNTASSVDTIITIVTTDGTAGTSDYTTTTTTVVIPAGETSVSVSVPILEDVTDEPSEEFTVDGTVTSGNTSNTDPSGTVTITDNDATPTVTIEDVTVDEGDGTVTIPVTIDVPSSVDTVVDIVTTTGTAGTSDYTETTTTVVIPAGETSVDVIIPITDDTISESPEDFTVDGTVTSGNTTNTDPSGTVTITDNDSVNVTIGDVTVDEGDGTATVPVTLNTASSVDTIITIVTTDGTAGTSDYTTTTTTVVIPAGETSVSVSVPILEDVTDEPSEEFTVDGTVTSGNTSNTDPSGTVTITDNDATPTVTIEDVTVDEGDGTVTIPVTIDVPSSVDTVVDIVTTTGTAGTSDYTETTTTVVIPAGETSVDVIIPITDDTISESPEDFTVDGTVTSGNTTNTDPSGTVTITDNDSVNVTIGDVTVDEGDGTATVPVTLNTASSVDTIITIVTTDGTAGTSDYTTTTTTVVIPAGETSVSVSVPILEDVTDEPSEEFTVDGTVTSGNTSNTDPSGTVTITDNDATPTVTIEDVTVDEGDGTVTIPVTIDVPSSVDTVVDIVTTTGTAGTSDYTETTTTVVIPAGETSVDVIIPITDDTISESPEDFTVDGTVTSGNTTNTDPSGTVTITDNDSVNVTIGDVTVDEGDGTATVPVTLNTASSVDTIITIVTTDGTAGTSDYTTTTTTVVIPAGETSVSVSVPILEDVTDEPSEEFTVDGTVTSGNTSNTDPSGTVTITDNDATPTVTIEDVTVDEGDGTVTIPVTIDVPSSVDTVVDIVTTTGTAGTSDYTETTTTVVIPAGETSVDVIIPITDDTISESPEDFTVDGTVTSGNTTNTDPSGTVTITDNDSVNVTIGDVTVDEGDGTATVPVTLNTASSVDTIITIVTTDGTAGTSDYTTTTTTVVIPAGETSVSVSVPILEDVTDEPSEEFTVDGTVTSGNTSNTDPSGTVTITDNDATPTVTIEDVTVDEGDGTVTIPVTIDVPSSVDTVVDIVTTTGTAGTSDYTETTTTVVIPAGETSVDVIIPITDDTISESPEDFTVDGTVTSGNTTNTDPSGTVTITDNDSVTITIGDVTVDEGDGTATVPVTIDVVSSVDTVVDIVTTTGTAGTSDYTETTTTVTIPAGETSVAVVIAITVDTISEGDEIFTVDGTVTSGNTSNTDPSGTVTIQDCLSDLDADCDGDGVTNGDELTPPDGEDPTDPTNPCEFISDDITETPSDIWLAADCDGDGVTNGDELTPPDGEDPTDPNNPCSFIEDDITVEPTIDWLAADCDGDGVTNGQEIVDGTDPLSDCSFLTDSVTLPQSTDWFNGDCDEDNVINGLEFALGDTDGDGIPNWLDTDDDNDGVDTINEDYGDVDVSDGDVDSTGNDDPTDNDTDGDGIPDYLDDDDDNDGILTIDENADSNEDGIGFGGDAQDSDGDGLPDYLEFDNGTIIDDLEVFQAVTPNGDNDNDVFVIKNIELFPENTVEIYNRWGVLVYETEGYGQNDNFFKGESNGRVTIKQKEQLPVGTYFYIVKYKKGDEAKSKAGHLYIQR
ncbi:Calx-beta domain-containing protein [Lacinutrix sp. Bg11-31]|uniref:Calx-beta domain-containing protein n=1 Tax=Lacinutrix sp. Bg11-31 TaxID=2057808 RepID=UPI000C31A4E5|nr:Calx-beta domain-containing protein [Lacinutrix sp. Bg11-31]AUC80835.1 hypothetical protein CW733_01275 [Lacinutrix sp. Bg11-31]